jgi:hypothetical protein
VTDLARLVLLVLAGSRLSAQELSGEVVIVRRGPNRPVEMQAGDHTPVLPGDIVKIPAPAPSPADISLGIRAARTP